MSEERVDQEVVDDIAARYETDHEEFLKAGLFPEGMYRWEFESVSPGVTNFDDVKQDVIICRLLAAAKAHYIDGELVEVEELETPRYKTHNFKLTGNGPEQLLTAYQAVVGRPPTGTLNEKTGRYTSNLLDIAEKLVGGTAWNSIYHFKPEGKTETFAVLSKKFRKQPLQRFGKKAEEIPF